MQIISTVWASWYKFTYRRYSRCVITAFIAFTRSYFHLHQKEHSTVYPHARRVLRKVPTLASLPQSCTAGATYPQLPDLLKVFFVHLCAHLELRWRTTGEIGYLYGAPARNIPGYLSICLCWSWPISELPAPSLHRRTWFHPHCCIIQQQTLMCRHQSCWLRLAVMLLASMLVKRERMQGLFCPVTVNIQCNGEHFYYNEYLLWYIPILGFISLHFHIWGNLLIIYFNLFQ